MNGCEINLERFPQMRKYTTMQHRWDSLRQRKGIEMNRLQDLRKRGVALVADLRDATTNGRCGAAVMLVTGGLGQSKSGMIGAPSGRGKHEDPYEGRAGVDEKDSPEQKCMAYQGAFRTQIVDGGRGAGRGTRQT